EKLAETPIDDSCSKSERQGERRVRPDLRDHFFDWLKGVGIIAVILIHVVYLYKDDRDYWIYYEKDHFYYYLGNFVNNVLRFTIPLFLLCSGILLTPFKLERKSIFAFYNKKLLRLIPPYILCTILFHYDKPIGKILTLLLTGKGDVPFYFMMVLFQCYFIYPFLVFFLGLGDKIVVGGGNPSGKGFRVSFLAALPLMLVLLISLISEVYPYFWFWKDFPLATKYIFPFAYGVYARKFFLNYDRERAAGGLFLWILIMVYYLVYILVTNDYYYNSRYFFGVATFHLFFYYREALFVRRVSWSKIFSFLGSISLWIFLVHYHVLIYTIELFRELRLFEGDQANFYFQQTLVTVVAIPVSILVAYICHLLYTAVTRPLFQKIEK
ncbi:MAG: acyltransferase, partial [Oligoflexia bacterium]|nr:acyltransferase [Oligoflexia bacterium]